MNEVNIPGNLESFKYDDAIVRKFLIATLLWAGVAFLLGIWIALELAFYPLNTNLPYFSFGRLRPLHTNAAIFAFAGNAIFAGIYYSTQRLLKARMLSDVLSKIHFWGWQLIIVSAAVTLPLGLTSGKEYAELEWPIDIAITLIWVVFAWNFFGTIIRRRERHIYVAIWFYIATVIAIALLHIVNSLAIPFSAFKSYSIYAGAQDALVQWWYGHNAVAFFLTTPFLGLMYYFIPKAIGRPVYSYKLSIIHFWSLVFLYIWAGPHHLLYTALPEWAQTVGMIFSLMLWAPSWGGMINGLLTLRGAWHRLRTEPVLKFLIASVTFYGMSTFEGPLLSVKSVSSLAHYTDWIIGHVHSGALGWNGLLTFGMAYYLVPKLWNTKLYSERLANWHFWTATMGIMIYIISMWSSGITQGLMWRAVDEAGKLLYPDFSETVLRIIPMYWVRAVGGFLFFVGYLIGIYNIVKTIRGGKAPEEETFKAPALSGPTAMNPRRFHHSLEGLPIVFSVLTLIAVAAGSIMELVPTLTAHSYVQYKPEDRFQPYSALELAGRDLYVREGCYTCHSQQIRPLVAEKLRYGEPSTLEESMYDHPFQWGSKRTGPDLSRVATKYPDLWHYRHMLNPRDVTPTSVMPAYPWMFTKKINFDILPKKLNAMRTVGVPYTDEQINAAADQARADAKVIAAALEKEGAEAKSEDKEIVALIAYLQRLGQKESRK